MNKSITLLFLTITFILFAGCKKENNYMDESGLSVVAYPIEHSPNGKKIDISSSSTNICKLKASIIAPSAVEMRDHGFIVNQVSPAMYIPLGAAKTRGYVSTVVDFGPVTLANDNVVFYAVLASGDSLRSDTPGVIKGATAASADLTITNFTLSSDSLSGDTELNVTINYNNDAYYIIAENILYKDPKTSTWNTATITPAQGSLTNFIITGNSSVNNFTFSKDSPCDFQIQVILAPISGAGSPVTGTSSTQTTTYN